MFDRIVGEIRVREQFADVEADAAEQRFDALQRARYRMQTATTATTTTLAFALRRAIGRSAGWRSACTCVRGDSPHHMT